MCFATGGLQPSCQSASLRHCPVNYSVVTMADTIIKSATERPNSMFPPDKNRDHVRVYQTKVTRISEFDLAYFSRNFIFSNFLKLFWFFSIFLYFSREISIFSILFFRKSLPFTGAATWSDRPPVALLLPGRRRPPCCSAAAARVCCCSAADAHDQHRLREALLALRGVLLPAGVGIGPGIGRVGDVH